MKNGVAGEELLDTKTYIKGNIALSMESTEVRMGQLARNEMNYGRYIPFEEIVEKIDKISCDDVARITQRLFSNQTLSLVSIGNLKDDGRRKAEIKL